MSSSMILFRKYRWQDESVPLTCFRLLGVRATGRDFLSAAYARFHRFSLVSPRCDGSDAQRDAWWSSKGSESSECQRLPEESDSLGNGLQGSANFFWNKGDGHDLVPKSSGRGQPVSHFHGAVSSTRSQQPFWLCWFKPTRHWWSGRRFLPELGRDSGSHQKKHLQQHESGWYNMSDHLFFNKDGLVHPPCMENNPWWGLLVYRLKDNYAYMYRVWFVWYIDVSLYSTSCV